MLLTWRKRSGAETAAAAAQIQLTRCVLLSALRSSTSLQDQNRVLWHDILDETMIILGSSEDNIGDDYACAVGKCLFCYRHARSGARIGACPVLLRSLFIST